MILANPFNQEQFNSFIEEFLPDFQKDQRKVDVGRSGFTEIIKLGESPSLMTTVLIVKSVKNLSSRISLTSNSFKILKAHSIYRALIVYLNENDSIWRLSLLSAEPKFDASGKVVVNYSNPHRNSYVLGTDVGIATARKFLVNLGSVTGFDDLKYRFSIEAINKEFYNDVSKHFYELIGSYDASGKMIEKPDLKLPGNESHRANQEYAIRLFGRIIFCWFLKEKKSSNNIQLLPSEIFDKAIEDGEDILHKILEPLFFKCLNTPLEDREVKYAKNHYKLVPYLNGGLFHPNEGSGGDYFSNNKASDVTIKDKWFHNLLETLNTYNFTLDENLDFDVELSIDPEMLGRIFENLLAEINPETGESARRTTGSFYTPRRIVSYMTDISLKQYLLSKTNVEESKLCRACFSGVYPIAIPTDMSEGKMRLEVTDIHTEKIHK